MHDGKMARTLGAAGIGIGLTEIFAPRWLSRQLGVRTFPALTRAMGAREIAAGVSIFAGKERLGQWARVAGDALDIALLGVAANRSRRRKVVFGVLAAIVAITVIDVFAARSVD